MFVDVGSPELLLSSLVVSSTSMLERLVAVLETAMSSSDLVISDIVPILVAFPESVAELNSAVMLFVETGVVSEYGDSDVVTGCVDINSPLVEGSISEGKALEYGVSEERLPEYGITALEDDSSEVVDGDNSEVVDGDNSMLVEDVGSVDNISSLVKDDCGSLVKDEISDIDSVVSEGAAEDGVTEDDISESGSSAVLEDVASSDEV